MQGWGWHSSVGARRGRDVTRMPRCWLFQAQHSHPFVPHHWESATFDCGCHAVDPVPLPS